MTSRTRKFLWYAIAALLAAYLLADRLWLQDWRQSQQNDSPAASKGPRGGAVSVDLLILDTYDFQDRIIVSGTLASNEEVDLSSESSGKITAINFKEGSRVKAGDLLVKINDKDLQAQYDRARFREKLAQEKERRQRVLLEKEAVSQEEYDMSLTELNSLKAETQLIRAQIERTEIRAPFDGRIGLRRVSVGEYISPTVVVARLVNTDPIKINFAIPEKYHGKVSEQTPVNFRIDGREETFKARIYAIEPKVDLNTRTVQLRAQAPNPQGLLLPGLFARMELNLASLQQALLLPAEALISEATGQKVFLWKNGQAEARTIGTGTRTDRFVQAVSGVAKGDTLVVTGTLQLRPGAALKVRKMVKLSVPKTQS